MKYVASFIILLLLTACETNPPAPVTDRMPNAGNQTKPAVNNTKTGDTKMANAKDWRPDTHIVKKGDTLFALGLEYGVDYKEIASANNIAPPYAIKIGQTLDLRSFKLKPISSNNQTNNSQTSVTTEPDDNVVISAIKTEPTDNGTPIAAQNKTVLPKEPTILSEPKAIRENYSLEAFNRATALKTTPLKTDTLKTDSLKTSTQTAEAKSTENKQNDAKTSSDESINWIWPTQGKVVAGFNESTNKGFNINGTLGQAIQAAADGKVIYSGSDLRGYGKLVIIKHNKIFLSVYAHNSKIVVKEGQVVGGGQKIAEMGSTDSNNVKLHFEIRRLGKSVDPAKYLN